MALVKKIASTSRNGDVSALLTLMVGAFAETDWSADVYLATILEKISVANRELIESLRRLTIYSRVAEKDRVRDALVKDLFKLIGGYLRIPIAELQEAAVEVDSVMGQYGLGIQYIDHAEESAALESLLNDLSKSATVAAAAKLQGVPETIAALDAAQKDFETVILQQAESKSVKNDLISASKLKSEIVAEINDNLVGYLSIMAKVNPADYAAISKTIAVLVNDNNSLVKRRNHAGAEDAE